MGRWNPPFNTAEMAALDVMPKISATVSIIASGLIIYHILGDRTKRQRVYERIMVGMAAMDLLYSLKAFLSTWMLPADFLLAAAYNGRGSIRTCTVSGFFGQGSGLSSIIYNGSLAFYFLITIRFGWKEKRVRDSGLEKAFHFIPILIGWGTAFAGLPLTLYNAVGWTCWIGAAPFGCKDSRFGEEANCLRGDNFWMYRWLFWYAELWTVLAFQVGSMYFIYRFVLAKEIANEKHSFGRQHHVPGASPHNPTPTDGSEALGPEEESGKKKKKIGLAVRPSTRSVSVDDTLIEPSHRKHSRQCAKQAVLYSAAFLGTYIFPMIWFCIEQHNGQIYKPLVLLAALIVPLQGFFNFCIYARPIYLRYKNEKKKLEIRKSRMASKMSADGSQQRPSSNAIASRQFQSNSNIRFSGDSEPASQDFQDTNTQQQGYETEQLQHFQLEPVEESTREQFSHDQSGHDGNVNENVVRPNIIPVDNAETSF